jgi:hypothetical protein
MTIGHGPTAATTRVAAGRRWCADGRVLVEFRALRMNKTRRTVEMFRHAPRGRLSKAEQWRTSPPRPDRALGLVGLYVGRTNRVNTQVQKCRFRNSWAQMTGRGSIRVEASL